MKRKISRSFVILSIVAILLTTTLITFVYYNFFCVQVMEDLKDSASLLQEYGDLEGLQEDSGEERFQGIRVTLINSGGEVLFDNGANRNSMENHFDRPEIKDALANGEGESVRNSQTMSRNSFYYAIKLSDGNVLRVAKDAGSIFSIFSSVLPSILWILAALALLSIGMAHFLAGKLIIPIERLAENMDDRMELEEYQELKPFIDRIRKQHQDLVKNARMRQEFTANVSHELKTPLTSISGYAELIETGMASQEDVVHFASGIHRSANRLLALINDIIRLSELDAGEAQPPFEKLNLYDMAMSCVEMLDFSAQKHEVTLSADGSESYIHGNRRMIDELLYNLIDNAIRYNNKGGSVSVSVYPDSEDAKKTILTVEDTGIGIPKEHQERIFERFYRVDKSRSQSTGGTGLGLAIVKHIIARHKADMELESEVGKGTRIKVTFTD